MERSSHKEREGVRGRVNTWMREVTIDERGGE